MTTSQIPDWIANLPIARRCRPVILGSGKHGLQRAGRKLRRRCLGEVDSIEQCHDLEWHR